MRSAYEGGVLQELAREVWCFAGGDGTKWTVQASFRTGLADASEVLGGGETDSMHRSCWILAGAITAWAWLDPGDGAGRTAFAWNMMICKGFSDTSSLLFSRQSLRGSKNVIPVSQIR